MVVTTTWEGIYAAAAVAVDITVIVPPGRPNPSAFEPAPEQLAPAAGADFLLYSQAEPFAQQARDVASSETDAIVVDTDNTAANVVAEVARLGALFGTTETANTWVEEFEAAVDGFEAEIHSQIGADEPVVAASSTPLGSPPWSPAGSRPPGRRHRPRAPSGCSRFSNHRSC